jgi:hypothetical protein
MEFLSKYKYVFINIIAIYNLFSYRNFNLNDRIKSAPFIVKFPIFVSFGLVVSTIAAFIVGIVYAGNGVLQVFTIIIILSTILGKAINDYLWFVFPGRLFVFLIILDWIMILTYVSDFVDWFVKNKLGQRI